MASLFRRAWIALAMGRGKKPGDDFSSPVAFYLLYARTMAPSGDYPPLRIMSKNSELALVCFILSSRNSIASISSMP